MLACTCMCWAERSVCLRVVFRCRRSWWGAALYQKDGGGGARLGSEPPRVRSRGSGVESNALSEMPFPLRPGLGVLPPAPRSIRDRGVTYRRNRICVDRAVSVWRCRCVAVMSAESSSSPSSPPCGECAGVCTISKLVEQRLPHIIHSPKRACVDVCAPSLSGSDSQPRPILASSGRRGGERRRTERASRVPP